MKLSENLFSPDYFTARDRFREAVPIAGGRLETIPLVAKGPKGEGLGIDIGWFGTANPRRVLLHSSGLHGVEGFAGSAIQLQLLGGFPRLPEDAALVAVHILNPYGMAWLRRFNENNVDLNRNFLDDEKYAGAPEAYSRLDSFLNPQSPPSMDFYTVRIACLILRYGMPVLKQAIAGGQYEYPRGLFFGGESFQLGPEKYATFLADRLASVKRLIAIDVHTGLGKSGEDTLLVGEEHYESLRRIFGERVAPSTPDQSVAYRTRGSLETIFPRAIPKTNVFFVTQEFGTYSPTKVLHSLREENRWHHYGAGTPDHPTKQALRETFDPKDEAWRRSVLERGRTLIAQGLTSLLDEA